LVKEGKKDRRAHRHPGPEDHLGDMDFKWAGTGPAVTRFRWIIKIYQGTLRAS